FVDSAPLRAGAHVMTVQQSDGPEDTLLMVYPFTADGIRAAPIQLDDDNGLGAMSWMHLGGPCAAPQGCGIIVARRTNTLDHTSPIKRTVQPGGNVTVVVDDKIHVTDTDKDGLSDELEHELGSNPSLP